MRNDWFDKYYATVFIIALAVVIIAFIVFIVNIVQYELILQEFAKSARMIKDGKMFFW